MNTNVWGSSAWRFIHSVTLAYPEEPTREDRQKYKEFFESLCYVLPCEKCCFNYRKELQEFNLDKALESRESLSKWGVDLHNSVNRRLHKPEMSHEEVAEMYKDLVNNAGKSFLERYKLEMIALGMSVGAMIFMVKYYRKK